MFIVTHTAMGALIGELLPTHPAIAFFLSIGAHFMIDIIPHGDTDLYKGYVSGSKVNRALAIVAVDGAVAVLLTIFLFAWRGPEPKLSVAAGIAGGVLPDLLVGLYELTHARAMKWFHRVHFFFHNLISGRTGDLSLPLGLGVEVLVLALVMVQMVKLS